jgi:hypothetical protein
VTKKGQWDSEEQCLTTRRPLFSEPRNCIIVNEILLMSTNDQNRSMGLGKTMFGKEFLEHLRISLKSRLKKERVDNKIKGGEPKRVNSEFTGLNVERGRVCTSP